MIKLLKRWITSSVYTYLSIALTIILSMLALEFSPQNWGALTLLSIAVSFIGVWKIESYLSQKK